MLADLSFVAHLIENIKGQGTKNSTKMLICFWSVIYSKHIYKNKYKVASLKVGKISE